MKDSPAGRCRLVEAFYRETALRRYGRAELSFLRWEVARGVLNPPSARRPGSPWWRAVNERLLRDKIEAWLLLAGAGGTASAYSVELWARFLRSPSPARWYRAHNASVAGGYLEHEPLAYLEVRSERFMMNVALLRVFHAHAMVAEPRLAAGRLARAARAVADPRRGTVGLFLDLRHAFPVEYPLDTPLDELIAVEGSLARSLDYGVIAPRLEELYAFAASSLRLPVDRLTGGGVPSYAWAPEDRPIWYAGNSKRYLRLVARATGAGSGYDRWLAGAHLG
ncbi:hypothetical protein [Pseudonocardia acaciae]|uniref:hypothetical protein n=1 Tax=Pseudonocardia acaciae TaxID=551276 RepID=UPI000AA99B5E|nr:hypothetical protein [Pseudonocardia acaciae]